VHAPLGIQLAVARPKNINCHFVHLRKHVALKTDALLAVGFVEVRLELIETQLVPRLEFAIVFASLLDRVVSQMHQPVVEIMYRIFSAGGSEIPFFIQIRLQVSVLRSHQRKRSYIKFPSVD